MDSEKGRQEMNLCDDNTSNALDALVDAYKARSNALGEQTNIEQEKMIVESLPSLYPLQEAAIKAVIGVISSTHENDLPDTNVGEMITKQQVIDVLERVKRTANDILYDGPVLMSYNDVLDSLINIVNLMPEVQQKIIHCKDCKYFKQVFAPNDNDGLCGHWHSKCDARTNRNSYCSHAERREVTT